MQAFILSDNGIRTGLIEKSIEAFVADSVHSAAFLLDNPDSLVSMQATLEQSSLVIVDAADGVSVLRAWQVGMCFAMGLPLIVLGGKTPQLFPPFLHVVTVVSSLPILADAVGRLAQAIEAGQEAYAEVATILHMEFLERLNA